MFESYYNAALAAWRQLYGYALIGKLANGGPMPTRMQAAILAHYPVVLSIVLQGRRTPAADVATHYRLVARTGRELRYLDSIADAFMTASVVATVTTPPWTAYRQMVDSMRATNPELADSLPNPTVVDLGLIAGLGLAGLIGVMLLQRGGGL